MHWLLLALPDTEARGDHALVLGLQGPALLPFGQERAGEGRKISGSVYGFQAGDNINRI